MNMTNALQEFQSWFADIATIVSADITEMLKIKADN